MSQGIRRFLYEKKNIIITTFQFIKWKKNNKFQTVFHFIKWKKNNKNFKKDIDK